MGVRTKIEIKKINELIKRTNIKLVKIENTIDGISDTTYIGYDNNNIKYIFKIYEFATKNEVINEINILNSLKELPITKAITKKEDIKLYQNKPTALFKFLEGKSPQNITKDMISEIGKFLGKFHSQAQELKSINENIYSQIELKNYFENIRNSNVEKTILKKFEDKYNEVKDLDLSNDGIIHGDLFPDNAKFTYNKLSGVFDFIEACNGNFSFDLSVVINSWCFDSDYKLNDKFFHIILESYNKYSPNQFEQKDIIKYMKYACLFYAMQRYNTKYVEKRDVDVKDYNEYLIKFNNMFKL